MVMGRSAPEGPLDVKYRGIYIDRYKKYIDENQGFSAEALLTSWAW